jgi:hypothetical protein
MRSLSYTFFDFPVTLVGSNIGFGWSARSPYTEPLWTVTNVTRRFRFAIRHIIAFARRRSAAPFHELVNTVGTAVQALDPVSGKYDKRKNETGACRRTAAEGKCWFGRTASRSLNRLGRKKRGPKVPE